MRIEKQSIYALLNQDTKAWHYHSDLRRYGEFEEARRRERKAIRSRVKLIRQAYLLFVHDKGFRLRLAYEPNKRGGGTRGTLSGAGAAEAISEALRRCRPEIPRIDARDMPPNAAAMLTIRGPTVTDNKIDNPNEKGEYLSYCEVPTGIYAAIWEEFGATVHWGNLNAETWKRKAAPTIARLKEGENNG